MLNKPSFKTICITDSDEDPYHLTLSFKNNEDIGYVHLIEADTDSPRIEAFEIQEEYRKLGYGEKLIMYIPKIYKLKNLPLKELRVKPCATDPSNVPQEQIVKIYRRIQHKLFKKYHVYLDIET